MAFLFAFFDYIHLFKQLADLGIVIDQALLGLAQLFVVIGPCI